MSACCYGHFLYASDAMITSERTFFFSFHLHLHFGHVSDFEMLIKVPDADEISFESTNSESLKVKDLIEKLSNDLKEKELIFVANGFVLDPTKSLKEYDISDTSIIHCLVKHRLLAAHHPKERARSNLPPNPVEVVKSFRVLIDQLDMPFGEKLKDIVNNEETFASLLTTVPGRTHSNSLHDR